MVKSYFKCVSFFENGRTSLSRRASNLGTLSVCYYSTYIFTMPAITLHGNCVNLFDSFSVPSPWIWVNWNNILFVFVVLLLL